MIHLEGCSGWCASQGTPDRDCGYVASPARSPDPAGFGPQGVPLPTFCSSLLPWAGVPPAEVRPDALPSHLPMSPLLAKVCCSTANLEIRLWAGGGEVRLEARSYRGTTLDGSRQPENWPQSVLPRWEHLRVQSWSGHRRLATRPNRPLP